MVATGSTYNITLVARTEGDLSRLTGQLRQVQNQARQTEASLTGMGKVSGGDMFGGLKDNLKGLLAFFGAYSIGQYVFDATARVQQFETAVQSFTGSSAIAGQAWKDVQEIAAKGFSLDPLIRAEQTFLSLGYSLGDAKSFMESIAKVGSGTDAAALDRISLAFTQIAAKGKVSLEEIRQLGEAGVPALAMFSQAAGMTASEFQKAASLGQILSADVLPAVRKQIDAMYGAAYEARPDTLFGNLGEAQVGLQNLANTWGEKLTPAINLGLNAATGFLSLAQQIPPQVVLMAAAGLKFKDSFGGIGTAFRATGAAARDFYRMWDAGMISAKQGVSGLLGSVKGLKAGLVAVAAVAAATVASGAFAADAPENIDRVEAALARLVDTQKSWVEPLGTIKYGDQFGSMVKTITDPGIVKRAEDFAAAIGGIFGLGPGRSKDTAEFLGNLKQMDGVLASWVKGGKVDQAARAWGWMVQAAKESGVSIDELKRLMPQYQGTLEGVAAGTIKVAAATDTLTLSMEDLGKAQDRTAEQATARGRGFLETSKIMSNYAKSITDAKEASEKGRRVTEKEKDALMDLAGAALDVAENQIKAGKGVDTVVESIKRSHADFVTAAKNMGYTAEQAEALAKQAGLVPEDIKVAFKASGLADLDELNKQLRGISDYEKATGQRLSSQRMEINAKLEQTVSLIASQTIPVRVMNPGDIRPGSTGGSGFASWGTGAKPAGRMGAVAVARHVPTRMVTI